MSERLKAGLMWGSPEGHGGAPLKSRCMSGGGVKAAGHVRGLQGPHLLCGPSPKQRWVRRGLSTEGEVAPLTPAARTLAAPRGGRSGRKESAQGPGSGRGLTRVLRCSRHLPSQQPLRELRERVPAALCRHPPQERLQPLLRGGLPVRRGLRGQRQELHPAAQLRLLRGRQVLRGRPPGPPRPVRLRESAAAHPASPAGRKRRGFSPGRWGGDRAGEARAHGARVRKRAALALARPPTLAHALHSLFSPPCLSPGPSDFLSCES